MSKPNASNRHGPVRGTGVALAGSLLLHAILTVLAVASLLPFFWLICATFKQHQDFFQYQFLPWSQPRRWTLSNYSWLFIHWPFARWLCNSVMLASAQTVLIVTLSSLGGFALCKYRFRGKKPLMFLMLGTMLLPSQVLLPSNYELMYRIGWLDTYAGILIPSAVSVFGMFLFMQATRSVPDELLQAGRVDGCSELRLWWEVALPIVRPMIGAFTLAHLHGLVEQLSLAANCAAESDEVHLARRPDQHDGPAGI